MDKNLGGKEKTGRGRGKEGEKIIRKSFSSLFKRDNKGEEEKTLFPSKSFDFWRAFDPQQNYGIESLQMISPKSLPSKFVIQIVYLQIRPFPPHLFNPKKVSVTKKNS